MKFYTDAMKAFMGGYEPVIAEQIVNDKRGQAAKETAKRLTAERAEGKARGGWGDGTIGGLSGATVSDPRKARMYNGRRFGFRENSIAYRAWALVKEHGRAHETWLADRLDVQPHYLRKRLADAMTADVLQILGGFYTPGTREPVLPKFKGRKERSE